MQKALMTTHVLSQTKIQQICKISKITKGISTDGRVRVEASQTVWRQYAKDLTQDVPHVVRDEDHITSTSLNQLVTGWQSHWKQFNIMSFQLDRYNSTLHDSLVKKNDKTF